MSKVLPNLYPLRFVLATLVVIFHIPETSRNLGFPTFSNLPLFHKGILAVFYFFSLSGFLIIRNLYLQQKDKGVVDIKEFYKRRLTRLMPVYFVVLLVGITVYHCLLPLFNIPFATNYSLPGLIVHYTLLVPNIFSSTHRVGGILNVLWSIGVEEQFYLVVPFLLALFKRSIVAVLLILLATLVCVLVIYPQFYVYSNFYFYFAAGGLLAILCEQKQCSFLNNNVIRIGLLLTFILSFTTNVFAFQNKAAFHIFNMIASALFISSISYFPLFVIKSRLLNYLGKVSYGIYMYHIIVMTGYYFLLQRLNLKIIINETVTVITSYLVILTLTFLIAHLSFRYFEMLFYRKSTRPGGGDKFTENRSREI